MKILKHSLQAYPKNDSVIHGEMASTKSTKKKITIETLKGTLDQFDFVF